MAKKPKKPKAPKVSASLTVWKNYETRLSNWRKTCAEIEKAKKDKAALIAKLRRAG